MSKVHLALKGEGKKFSVMQKLTARCRTHLTPIILGTAWDRETQIHLIKSGQKKSAYAIDIGH